MAAITFGVGVLLTALGFAAFRATRRFVARCLTTEGTIVSYTSEESDEGVHYFSVLRFADSSGAAHEIGGSRGLQSPPEVGTVVAITYDPSYPSNAWIAGTASPWVIPWLVLLAGLAFLIGSVAIRAGGG